ncbi:MAG: hypothetical protein FWD71_01360 [Oscillospiraceae bacterium]|nr:hypothetical protein [Oscillospiraceae bacterium]
MAKKDKPYAFAGVRNAKYALRDDDGKISDSAKSVELPKAKSLVLNPVVNTQDVYADDTKLIAILSDQGYTGTYGCTGQDEDFEEALGLIMELNSGLTVALKLTSQIRFDLYFEYTFYPAGKKPFIMKTWIYGVELGKPSINHSTNTQNVTIGEYQYPLTVYGEMVLDENDKPLTNEEGFELVALMAHSRPGDDNYDTFGDAPPIPQEEED